MVSVVEALETPETTVPFESLRERHPTTQKKGTYAIRPYISTTTDYPKAPQTS